MAEAKSNTVAIPPSVYTKLKEALAEAGVRPLRNGVRGAIFLPGIGLVPAKSAPVFASPRNCPTCKWPPMACGCTPQYVRKRVASQ